MQNPAKNLKIVLLNCTHANQIECSLMKYYYCQVEWSVQSCYAKFIVLDLNWDVPKGSVTIIKNHELVRLDVIFYKYDKM